MNRSTWSTLLITCAVCYLLLALLLCSNLSSSPGISQAPRPKLVRNCSSLSVGGLGAFEFLVTAALRRRRRGGNINQAAGRRSRPPQSVAHHTFRDPHVSTASCPIAFALTWLVLVAKALRAEAMPPILDAPCGPCSATSGQ